MNTSNRARNNSEDDDDSESEHKMSLRELFKVTYKYSAASFFALFYTLAMFPAIMSNLKSSTQYTEGSWAGTYFLPVVVFLCFNLGDTLGRMTTTFLKWPGKNSIMSVSIARGVFIPLLLMCNIQPRSSPTVWFTSDFWPMILIFNFGWSNGHILSLAVSYAPQDVVGDGNKASIGTIKGVGGALGLVGGSLMVFIIQPIIGL